MPSFGRLEARNRHQETGVSPQADSTSRLKLSFSTQILARCPTSRRVPPPGWRRAGGNLIDTDLTIKLMGGDRTCRGWLGVAGQDRWGVGRSGG
jgi:hypothetical protein